MPLAVPSDSNTPFSNIINLLTGDLTSQQASDRLPSVVSYWLAKGQTRIVSKKMQNEESRSKIYQQFLHDYENFLNNEQRSVYTLLHTHLFRKLAKVPNSKIINDNMDFMTSIQASVYLESAAFEINSKVEAFKNDPHMLVFIANLFSVSADPQIMAEEKAAMYRADNYIPTLDFAIFLAFPTERVKIQRKKF